MDKTPAWINWALLQAINLDCDLKRKINMAMGGLVGGGPAAGPTEKALNPNGLYEENEAFKKLGFKPRRQK